MEKPFVVTTQKKSTVTKMRRFRLDYLLIPAVFVAFIFLWDLLITIFDIRSVILPRPLSVWQNFTSGLNPDNSLNYYTHILGTLYEVLFGYIIGAIVGIALALLLSQIPLLERVFKPFIVAFQSIPKIAIAPLIIIWFGFGVGSKIALVILIVFFPVLVNGLSGFKSVEPERLAVMRSLGASQWKIFSKLVLPGSLPFLFAGLEVALVQAMTAAIVAEFLAGREGLGVLIIQMEQVLNTGGIFGVLTVLAILGWLLTMILNLIRKKLVFWSDAERSRK
ncbi:ABC transporter permease [Bacillus sp. UNC41MFS5]|uniref:ABC transporter permease n=1 Tax=Bacillus sp. UNC41MFS5 TaxID=1449046 RepID=UPI000479F743|nr:ABC transporter permease [Bacillus sp. UNC41MFS5]